MAEKLPEFYKPLCAKRSHSICAATHRSGHSSVSGKPPMPFVAIRSYPWLIVIRAIVPSVALLCVPTAQAEPLIYFNKTSEQAQPLPPPPVVRQDQAVAVAMHAEPTALNPPVGQPAINSAKSVPRPSSRRLAPRSNKKFGIPSPVKSDSDRARSPFSASPIESLGTAGAGLAIVVGLFFVCVWLLRRGGPKPTSPLPKDAVAVLGRVPLVGRNFAQLIQIGNKLVLVSITPDGVTTPITEITDPTEVDRLLGICLRNHKHSTTAEFQQVLQQLADEPTQGFLGAEAQAMPAGYRR